MSPPPALPVPRRVLVLTRNEAVNIRACLASASLSDDFVAFNRFCNDETVVLAHPAGSGPFPHAFVRLLQQPNWDLGQVVHARRWAEPSGDGSAPSPNPREIEGPSIRHITR